MTCRGGCIGGGGQPKVKIPMADKVRQKRIAGLYNKDQSVTQRLAHENPDITKVYDEFFKKPLSPLAEELLHTVYSSKKHILGE
ncbi:iron hydrogenase small subunit [Clostridium pasteurianum]|nr:iron hydrogenase small subunit [Clostridium pasteurianum]